MASTHQLDAIVATRPARYSIWRYIGTEAGVFRQYPGTRMVKEYDHTQQPWYVSLSSIYKYKGSVTLLFYAYILSDVPIVAFAYAAVVLHFTYII